MVKDRRARQVTKKELNAKATGFMLHYCLEKGGQIFQARRRGQDRLETARALAREIQKPRLFLVKAIPVVI